VSLDEDRVLLDLLGGGHGDERRRVLLCRYLSQLEKFCAVVAVINQSELAMADYDSAKVPISLVQTCT